MLSQTNPVALSVTLAALTLNCDAGASIPKNGAALDAEPVAVESASVQSEKKQDPEEATPAPSKKQPLPTSPATADLALAKVDAFIEGLKLDRTKPRWRNGLPFPPELEFDAAKEYFWHLRTNKGDVKIRFLPDVAPMHVSSSIYLIRSGFYDDLIFHRVIQGFMAQGGCPDGKGNGGPDYKYPGEFDPSVKHDRPGLLSMANAGPGTDGSQFFLTFVPTPWLDGKHTIFGEVIDGMSVLKALEEEGTRGGQTRERLEMIQSTVSVAPKKKAASPLDTGDGGKDGGY